MKYTGQKRDDIVYASDKKKHSSSSVSKNKPDRYDRERYSQTRPSASVSYSNLPKKKNDHNDAPRKNSRSAALPKQLIIAGLVLLALELILTGVFIFISIDLGVLPVWMLILAIVFVIVVLICVFALERQRKRGFKILGMVISVLMCVVLAAGSFIMFRADSVLASITGKAKSVSTYKVAVLADDPAETVADACDYTFGIVSSLENTKVQKALDDLNKDAGKTVNTYDCSTVKDLYEALFNKTCKAIVYDSNFESTFEETNENFLSEVKILAEYTVSVLVDNVSVNTDVLNKPFTIWISGNDEWGDDVSIDGRSDVNMLCTVNPVTHQVLLATIPRDFYVPLISDETDGAFDKITHAGIYGMDCQLATAANLLNVDSIDYYLRINFSSVTMIIDAIDGIDIDNAYEYTCTYEDITYPAGQLHLDGWEALWYARERKNLVGGDLERGQHQMQVIEAVINKLCSSASVTNFNALMDAMSSFAITNMSDTSIKAIVQNQLTNGGSWDIQKVQAKGEESYQSSFAAGGTELYVIIPYQESIDYIHNLITDMKEGKLLTDIESQAPTEYTLAFGFVEEDIDSSYDTDSYTDDEEP